MRIRRSQRLSLLSLRGFMPNTELLDAETVRQAWQERFTERGPDHPYWLYTHIPFCPQICSYCQCSTQLKRSDGEIDRYLDWLEGEISFFSSAAATGLAHWQYVGGGTVNVLREDQLKRLFSSLNAHFRFADDARRTFEFLPAACGQRRFPWPVHLVSIDSAAACRLPRRRYCSASIAVTIPCSVSVRRSSRPKSWVSMRLTST